MTSIKSPQFKGATSRLLSGMCLPALAVGFSLALVSSAFAGAYAPQVAALDDPANMNAVVAAGPKAVDDLSAALHGARPDLAVSALGRIGDPSGAKALVTLAKDPDGETRAQVAWALGRCGDPTTVPVLITLASDSYDPAKIAAISALVRFNSAEADGALASALGSADRDVRLAAAQALQKNPRPTLVPALSRLLQWHMEQQKIKRGKGAAEPKPGEPDTEDVVVWTEPSAQVRLAVIQTLGATKLVDALPGLITALERETSYNRLQIITAIESMGEPAASVCLGRIVPLPYDADAFDHRMPLLICNGTLATIAGRLGDARSVPYLLNTLKIPHKGLGGDKDLTELYIQTVVLLGKFKVDRAARPLAELIKEAAVQQLSDAIQTSIRQIGHAAARPLAVNLDDWRFAPIYLRLLREPELRTFAAREGILKLINHESDEVRLECTETLGLYLSEGILDEYDQPALDAMYLDHSRDVRAACARWKEIISKKTGDDAKP